MIVDEGQPWSPDGQRLLVHTPDNDGIGLLDLSAGSVSPLTFLPVLPDWTGDSCASWSPNGEQIAFLSTRRDGGTYDESGYPNIRTALYVIAPQGQAEPTRVLLAAENQWLGCPQWLSNDRIVFSRSTFETGISEIVSVNPSSADEHRHFHIEESIYRMAVSQASGKVAISTYTGCGCIYDVRVVKLDDDTVMELTNGPEEYSYGAEALSWNPDGTKLVMGQIAYSGWDASLTIADLSQPCPTCLSLIPDGWRSSGAAWSPDGAWIATFSYDEGLLLLTPDGSEVLPVLIQRGNNYFLAWQPLPGCTPDGAMRAFASNESYCLPATPVPNPYPYSLAYLPVGFDEGRYPDPCPLVPVGQVPEEPRPGEPDTGDIVKCWIQQSITEWKTEFGFANFNHLQLVQLIVASEYGSLIPLWVDASSESQRIWPDEALARRLHDWRYGCGLDGCTVNRFSEELYVFLSTYQAPRNYDLIRAQREVNRLSGRSSDPSKWRAIRSVSLFDAAVAHIFYPGVSDPSFGFSGDPTWRNGLEAPVNQLAPPHPYGWATVTNVLNVHVLNLTYMLGYCNEERFAIHYAGRAPEDGMQDIFFGVTIGSQQNQVTAPAGQMENMPVAGGTVNCTFRQAAYQRINP